jgi:hypothetical protein
LSIFATLQRKLLTSERRDISNTIILDVNHASANMIRLPDFPTPRSTLQPINVPYITTIAAPAALRTGAGRFFIGFIVG